LHRSNTTQKEGNTMKLTTYHLYFSDNAGNLICDYFIREFRITETKAYCLRSAYDKKAYSILINAIDENRMERNKALFSFGNGYWIDYK